MELDPHAHLHAPEEGVARARPGWACIPTAWSSTTATSGKLLDKLDELGIADNTIVMYSTDNGAEVMSWPDGGTTPFRGEKDTNWEGGWRVPCAIRWPGVIKPGTVSNEIFSHTGHAADAGWPRPASRTSSRSCKKGYKAGNKTFKVHIDGYNLLPFLKGEVKENPRKGFLYWSDDGDLMALRVRQLEGPLHGAARRRRRRLAGAVHAAASSRSSSTCAATRSRRRPSPSLFY